MPKANGQPTRAERSAANKAAFRAASSPITAWPGHKQRAENAAYTKQSKKVKKPKGDDGRTFRAFSAFNDDISNAEAVLEKKGGCVAADRYDDVLRDGLRDLRKKATTEHAQGVIKRGDRVYAAIWADCTEE